MTDRALAIAIALFAVAALALVWFATPSGPILSPDSIGYIRSVRLLQAGSGVLALDNHWPPGYALLLSSIVSLLGSEMLAARLVCAVSLALSLTAIAIFISRLGNLRAAVILLPLVLLTHLLASGFTVVYLYAISEPPFMAASCWALVAYQRVCAPRPGRGTWVLLACCLAAMLLLRYTAVPIVTAFLFSLAVHLLLSGQRWLPIVLVTGMACAAPLLIWLLLNIDGSAGTVREVSFHSLRYAHFQEFSSSLARWMGGIPGGLAVFIYVGVLLTAGWQWLTTRKPVVLLLLMWSVGYLLFIVLSLSFFDAHTPLSARIVLPLFPPFFLLLVCFATDFQGNWRRLDYNTVLAGILVAVSVSGLPALRSNLADSAAGAKGSASLEERSLELYSTVAALPAATPVYANTSEILFLVHGREVNPLPHLYDPLTMEQNEDFIADTAAMIEHMYRNDGVLLWMPVGSFRAYYPRPEVLLGFPLKIVDRADGGYLMVPDITEPR
jgi:hypothetical protein